MSSLSTGINNNSTQVHQDVSASSSGLHAGSAQWQPPIPSMAALPVDMSKTEPKPAYYKLQFGDDYTGFSYYVRTLGVVIGRKCEKPIQVPPPDIMSPQVPARPPLGPSQGMYETVEDLKKEDEGMMERIASRESASDILHGGLLGDGNILGTPPIPDLSTAIPAGEFTSLDLADGDMGDIVKREDGSATPDGTPGVSNGFLQNDEMDVKLEFANEEVQPIMMTEMGMGGESLDLMDGSYIGPDDLESGPPPPPPPPPPARSSSSVEHVDVDLGPLKSVSRNHAKIDFRAELGHFCLEIHGRNGAWVDDRYYVKGSAVPLYQGSVIQIATRIFSFILPPSPGGSPVTPHVLDASFDSNSPLDDVPYPYNLPASQLGYQEFFGESGQGSTSGNEPMTISQQVPQPFNAFTAQDGQGLGLGMEYDWSQDKRKGRHHWTEEWSSEDSEDSWDSWDESDEVEDRKIHRRRRRGRHQDEGESELSSVEDGSEDREEEEDDDDEDDEEEEEEGVEEAEVEVVPVEQVDEEMPEQVDKPKKKGKAAVATASSATAAPPVPTTANVKSEPPVPVPPIRMGPGKGPAKSGKLPAKSVKAVKALKAKVTSPKKVNGVAAGEDVVMGEPGTGVEDATKGKKVKVETTATPAKAVVEGPMEKPKEKDKEKDKDKPKPPPKKPAGPKKVKAAPGPPTNPNLPVAPKMPSTPGVLIPGLSVQVTPIPPPPPRVQTLASAVAALPPPPPPPQPAPAPRPPPAAAMPVRPPVTIPNPTPRPPPPTAVARPPAPAPPRPPTQAVRPPIPAAAFRPPPPPQMVRPPVPPTQFIPHQPVTPRPAPAHVVSNSAISTAASSPGGTPEPQKPFYLTELIETPGRPGHIIVNVPIPPSGAGPRPPPGPMIGLDGENFIGPPPIKPTATFAIIIYSALANLPRGRGTLGEVCNWIAGEWEWFRLNVDTGWQNSIRHNLSLNKAFLKVPRIPEDDPESKGSVWIIDPKEGPIFEEKQRKEAHKSEGKTRTAEMRAVRERQKVDERYRTPKEGSSTPSLPPPSTAPTPHHPTPLPRPPPAARVNIPSVRPTPRPPPAAPVPKGPVLPKEKVTVSFDTITPAMRAESLIQTLDSNGNPLPFVCSATSLVLERSAFGHLTPDIIEKLHMLGAHTAVEVLLSWVNNKNKQQLVKAAQAKAASANSAASSSGPSVRPGIRPNMMVKQARPPPRPPVSATTVRPPQQTTQARPIASASSNPSTNVPQSHPAPTPRPPVPGGQARPPNASGVNPRPPAGPSAPAKPGSNLGAAPPGASMKVIITMIATVAAANGDVKTVGKHAVALLRYIKIVGAAIDLKAAERIWATGIVPPSIKGAVGGNQNGVKPNGVNGGVRPPGVGGMAPKPLVRPPPPGPSAGVVNGVRPPPNMGPGTSTPVVRPLQPGPPRPMPVQPGPKVGNGAMAAPAPGPGTGGVPTLKRKLEDSEAGVKAMGSLPAGPNAALAAEAKRPKLEAGGS